MPEEAACQPHLPARKESPEHMDGGKNQMREMRLCAHVGALQRYSLPALHRPCGQQGVSRLRVREAARTGSGGLWGYGVEEGEKLHRVEAVLGARFPGINKKLKDFKTLTGRNKAAKISPKLTAKRLELAQVESEIEKLLDTLTGASPVLLSYANSKIEELDARRQSIANEIAKLSADAVPMEKMESISGYLDDWENVSFEDKRQVVDALITVIRATNEKVEIEWKI